MYCNSCLKKIPQEEITYCEQCGVPLCKSCANHCMVCGKELCDTCYVNNHYKCEECYKPDNTFQTIRRSHIEQYVGCPYSLYLQLVLGIEPPMGSHAQLGVIVHELIDKACNYDFPLKEALNELKEQVEKWNLSTDDEYSIITMELEETGKMCLEYFYNSIKIENDEFKSEYNIRYKIDDNLPMISCTLDNISFVKGKIHIHDWKTGKPMSGQKLVTDLQPPLYIYAIYKEFGKMPETFTLHYLKHKKDIVYRKISDSVYEVKTTRKAYTLDINEAIERTRKVLGQIKRNEFSMPDDKTHLWRCNNMCWFGTSGKCSGSQDEQWKRLNEEYDKKK